MFCRIRPTPRSVVACLPDGVSVRLQLEGKDHPFSFDKVFGATSSQVRVWVEWVSWLGRVGEGGGGQSTGRLGLAGSGERAGESLQCSK